MTHGTGSEWLLDARLFQILLAVWVALVVIYGLWRSRGTAPTDPLRPSGPIE